MYQEQEASIKTLQDIRSIMERSARFISLSGWSGVWAGSIALAGSFIAKSWLNNMAPAAIAGDAYYAVITKFVLLAIAVFIIALRGAYYFTWRKARQQGSKLFNSSSRRMLLEMAMPLAAGSVFALHFVYAGHVAYIAPACLAFYGLSLINGSKYTLSDIKYLGLCILMLGCINLFAPGYGLTLWAIGFGVLHILYGIVMWNKYDKKISKA